MYSKRIQSAIAECTEVHTVSNMSTMYRRGESITALYREAVRNYKSVQCTSTSRAEQRSVFELVQKLGRICDEMGCSK